MDLAALGDEVGMEGAFGEDGRRPMSWDERSWDTRLLEVYGTLIRARRGSLALRDGGLRFLHADADAVVLLREHPEQTALVHIARGEHDPIDVPRSVVPGVEEARTAYGSPPVLSGDRLTLRADGPLAGIWTWPTPLDDRPDWV